MENKMDDLETAQDSGLQDMEMKYKYHQGVMMLGKSEVEQVPKFKVRDDDVWVCSFPRSGTTLTQELTYLVMTLDFEKANTVQLDDRFPVIDLKHTGFPYYRGLGYADNLPMDSPRMLKSHFPYFLLPDDLTKRKKGRVIYICRNPKAAVSSWYNLMKYLKNPPAPTLRDYFEMFLEGGKGVLFGPWGRHVREFWEHRNDGNILFLQFEHVIKDRRGAVKKIADFLGRVLTEADVDKILQHTTLEHMKKNNAVNYSYAEKLYQTDKSEGEFINTGSLEAWKHIVPEDLQKRVDEYIHQELGNTDLKFE